MIDKTFAFLLDELNGFLHTRYPSNEPHAVLSALVNQDGTVPTEVENKLVLSLVNAERESAAPMSGMQGRKDGGGYARINPALSLNLYLLVAAHFSNNYGESLKFLSAALAFFQGKSVFTPQSSPALPKELDKLSIEMVSLNFQELNNLWSIQGGKYLPSVLYKARMLTVQEGRVAGLVPGASGAGAEL
ncbi:DUF4255 domain-containing protein [Methylomagnum sp.]